MSAKIIEFKDSKKKENDHSNIFDNLLKSDDFYNSLVTCKNVILVIMVISFVACIYFMIKHIENEIAGVCVMAFFICSMLGLFADLVVSIMDS